MGQLTLAEGLTIDALNRQEGSQEQERYKTWVALEKSVCVKVATSTRRPLLNRSRLLPQTARPSVTGKRRYFWVIPRCRPGICKKHRNGMTTQRNAIVLRGSPGNPYLWMGRAALWLQGGDRARLSDLAEIYGDELSNPRRRPRYRWPCWQRPYTWQI